jgi:ABC-type Co2+ transport system permease subunit
MGIIGVSIQVLVGKIYYSLLRKLNAGNGALSSAMFLAVWYTVFVSHLTQKISSTQKLTSYHTFSMNLEWSPTRYLTKRYHLLRE